MAKKPAMDTEIHDKLYKALAEIDHADSHVWDDGKPSLKYLTWAVGTDVTLAMVDEVAGADFVRVPPTDDEVKAIAAQKVNAVAAGHDPLPFAEPAVIVPPPVPTHEQMKQAEHNLREANRVATEAQTNLKAAQAAHDIVVTHMEKSNSVSFAHVVQDVQRRTQETAMARVGALKKFQEVTGGVAPSTHNSPLDARYAVRRTLARRASRAV